MRGVDLRSAVLRAFLRRLPVPSNTVDHHDLTGPFDIIGDVHGCRDELVELLTLLGYSIRDVNGHWRVRHPEGRRVVFAGDIVDAGPDVPGVLGLVMDMVGDGVALCCSGNHEERLRQAMTDEGLVRRTTGVGSKELRDCSVAFRRRAWRFVRSLPGHLVLDGGKLVVAHVGLKSELQGVDSPESRAAAVCGERTGKFHKDGRPIRVDWASNYHGSALVVHGHSPTKRSEWKNGTVDIDTGCVFGVALTALRYPERKSVSVPARQKYAEPGGRFLTCQTM